MTVEMATPTRVLLVEDAESFVDALVVGLQREGFEVTVARDGVEALERFDPANTDLVLLDVMLPRLSGIDVCRAIRARSDVPIIMVTAKSTELDTVVGLEVGADDYVAKPYRLRELVSRMRAVLRRGSRQPNVAGIGRQGGYEGLSSGGSGRAGGAGGGGADFAARGGRHLSSRAGGQDFGSGEEDQNDGEGAGAQHPGGSSHSGGVAPLRLLTQVSESKFIEPNPDDTHIVGDVHLDVSRHECFVRGEEVKLPLKEFELLEMLLANAGRVVTRDTLIDRVWGLDYVGDTKTLDVHIKRLRAKIEADPARPALITTIRGVGYRFEAPRHCYGAGCSGRRSRRRSRTTHRRLWATRRCGRHQLQRQQG